MSGFNLARYTLDFYSPEVVPAEEGSAYRWDMTDARLRANLPAMLEAVEEDLQKLMPEGYQVRIREERGT